MVTGALPLAMGGRGVVRACSGPWPGTGGGGNGSAEIVAAGGGGGVVAGTVTAPNWEPAFVTVPSVEICEVGERWETSTGVFDFSPEDLQACIASQEDPGIRTPVLKLGHTDPRFDGQPAVGRIENMRLSANGMTLLGDLVGVPLWLAKIMGSAFPRRSIEGNFEVTTRTGNTWPMVLTGLALLGDAYPAVDTLEDIKALWGSEAPPLYPVEDVEEIAATADGRFRARKVDEDMPNWLLRRGPVAAARSNVAASVSVYDLPREYYDQLEAGQMWWWVREILVNPLQLVVDDDEGGLLLVDVNVGANDTITFGEPTEVKVEYVAAGAAHRKAGQMVAATFKAAQDSGRPVRASGEDNADPQGAGATTERQGGSGMTPEQLAALGLPADATPEQQRARLAELSAATEGGGDGSGGDGTTPGTTGTPTTTPGTTETPAPATTTPGTEGNPASQPDTPSSDPAGQPATAPGTGGDTPAPASEPGSSVTAPPGTLLVDEAQWAEVQREIAAGRAQREQQQAADRDAFLETAIRAGKFPRARRDHYLAAWAADSVGTRDLIEKLPTGLVPVTEIGASAAPGDGEPSDQGPAYPESWKPTVVAARQGVGARIKVVGD